MENNDNNQVNIDETGNLLETDFKFLLERLIIQKEEANKSFKINIDQGLHEYLRIYIELESFFNKLQTIPNKEDLIIQYNNLRKIIYSNLANCYGKKENYSISVTYDEEIIKMDKMFDKSYARLILHYIKLENLNRAEELKKQMENIFSETVLNRYRNDIFVELKNAQEKKDQNITKFSKGLFKKLNKNEAESNRNPKNKKINSLEKVNDNPNNISIDKAISKKNKSSPSEKLRWILTTLALFSSLTGLYLLTKYRKIFIYNKK